MRFRKISGTQYVKIGRVHQAFKPGDVIEIEDISLIKKADPELKTWVQIKEEAEAKANVVEKTTTTDEENTEDTITDEENIKEVTTTEKLPSEKLKITRAKKLVVVEREDKSGWDVVNPKSKKPLNDKPLTKSEAETLIEDLTASK